MTTHANQLEAYLRRNQLLDVPVNWAEEIIFPAYDGYSLRNIPHTVADVLGVPFADNVPLDDAVWAGNALPDNIQRVVVFLMDGLGYKHLQMLCNDDPDIAQLVADITQGRGFVPLTSTAPSTTAVALTSLWTGGTPGQTGIFNTVMYLRELSTLGNMLRFRPAVGKHPGDIFADWGYPAESFAHRKGIGDHLAESDVPTYAVQYRSLMGSGLSGILHGGVARPHYLHNGYSDLMLQIEDALMATRGERCYINIYWAAVDALAHAYGAHNRYTHREVLVQLRQLRGLLDTPDVRDGQTLFILTADHGHHDVHHHYDVQENASLQTLHDAMMLGISGDGRMAHAYLRGATTADVQAQLLAECGDWLAVITGEDALAAGLFGVDTLPPALLGRVGDLVLIPRLGYVVEDSSVGKLPIISWHSGLSDWEMLIPFLWRSL